MKPAIELSFPHAWEVEILPSRPPILPQRHFVYPRHAEEIERGALEIVVRPASGTPFLGTFALGFADPAVPTGVWSCPAADQMCVLSGGYGYLVDIPNPQQFVQLPFRPVLEVRPIASKNLLLFTGHYALIAWGGTGMAWQTQRLSSEGVRIAQIHDNLLHGFGWDLITDREVPFTIDLSSGETVPGAAPQPAR